MAKTSMVNRDLRRIRTAKKYAVKRAALRKIIKDPKASSDEKAAASLKLQKQPRDASPHRIRNRCALTGRPHGYYRKFGLARNVLRKMAMQGHVPGLVKASW